MVFVGEVTIVETTDGSTIYRYYFNPHVIWE
jgi:hypothetical protein